MSKKKKFKQERVESLRAASRALRMVAMELVQVISKAKGTITDKSQAGSPCIPADRKYGHAVVQAVKWQYGGPMNTVQVLTRCGHAVYFTLPTLGDADSYLTVCECGDLIPHPQDTKTTIQFWTEKGALDIAIGTVTSTQQSAVRISNHIRQRALQQYERTQRRQQRYTEKKTPKVAKEDTTDRVIGDLGNALQPDAIQIISYWKRAEAAVSGTEEFYVKTSRGEYIVAFAGDTEFPFAAGAIVSSPAHEDAAEFWQQYGAVSVNNATTAVHEYQPLTKTGVDELSVAQGTAVSVDEADFGPPGSEAIDAAR